MFILQEVLMNIKVPKSTSYKIIAETFGQRYVAINTATVDLDHIMYRNIVLMEILCKFSHLTCTCISALQNYCQVELCGYCTVGNFQGI